MALIPKIKVCPASDNQSFNIFDITGFYNSATNTTGYGGGVNPDTTDVATATISVIIPKTIIPIVINVFPTFPTTDSGLPFVLTNTMLGITGVLPVGIYDITIEETGTFNSAPFDVFGNILYLFIGPTKCCLDAKSVDLNVEDCGCNGQDGNNSNRFLIGLWALLDAAQKAAACGMKNKAQKIIDFVSEECANFGECKDCN